MSYVVMKRLGDHVTLVSERVFASRQQALEELGAALPGPSEDVDTEYVVFDLDAASPVLLLPVEVEESLDIETPEAALIEEIVFDEGPSFVSESEELVLVGPAETVLVEVVTTEPLADAYIEDVVLPEEFADDLIIEDLIIEDFVVEETVEEDLAEEPAPLEADEKLAAKEQAAEPVPAVEGETPESETTDVQAQSTEPKDEGTLEEPAGAALIVADAEGHPVEEVSPSEANRVNLALDELLPIVELPASVEPEGPDEVVEEVQAAEPELEPEPEPELETKLEPEPIPNLEPILQLEPEAEPVAEAAPEPEMPGYEAGDSDLSSLTCEDCVYVTTCPNKDERTPSACGSFQWVSV